jgi:hypothetical protein
MADNSPDANELADVLRLASDPTKVELTTTAKYDLMGAGLTKDDLCEEIVAWIDGGESVKKVTLRGAHAGKAAYEIKPRINKSVFYLKLTLCEIGESDEYMLVISAHTSH